MSDTVSALATLLTESVRLWRVPARVECAAKGEILVSSLGTCVEIVCVGADLPYRWMVLTHANGEPPRKRPALSVVSVLRQVRLALDPGYAKERLRIAAPAMMPPLAGETARQP